jgi:tetratricopeptide (TPR) repeat protein
VLVLEDMHWADEGLLDFFDELVDWLSGVPALVVCSARPELLERRPGWGGGKLNATTVGLSPLSKAETALLIAATLERSVLPAETQTALLERAEGNPLYAEQFAQLYLERGSAENLELPETLQGIVAARLDNLSAEEKTTLQGASVIGKVFWVGSLGEEPHAVETRLRSLERKGFVTRQRGTSLEGESEWSFAHMLLRDVAYGQIPRGQRAARHRAAAEWIARLTRSEDNAELLAHHWRLALELARAAGESTDELVDPARLACREAGDRAYAINAFPAAASYYGDSLALWPDDDDRPRLLFRYADALYVADDDHAKEALETARDALLGVGERDTAAEAELALSRIWWHRGRFEKADAHQSRAEELVAGASSATAARVLAYSARTRAIGGDAATGLRMGTEALALAERLEIDELRAHALATIGLAKNYFGDPSGPSDEQQALEIATAARSPVAGSIANNIAVGAFFSFDLHRAEALWEEGERIAERFGDASGARWVRGQLAFLALLLGDWDDALERLDVFIAACEAGNPHYYEGWRRTNRALIREARGDAGGSLTDLRKALELVRERKEPQNFMPVLGEAVSLLEMQGLVDEARDLAREFVAVGKHNPVEAAWSLSHFAASRVALEQEQELRELLRDTSLERWRDAALACLARDFARAADLFAEAGSPTLEARYRMRAAEELMERGQRVEASDQAARATTFYRTVGATSYLDRLEGLLREAKTA